MRVTFAFFFAQFFLYTFGSFSKSNEWMKAISIFNYWDYSSVIFDDLFKADSFIALIVTVIVLLIIGIWVFEEDGHIDLNTKFLSTKRVNGTLNHNVLMVASQVKLKEQTHVVGGDRNEGRRRA